MDTVWDIVEFDIPILKGAVERMLVGLKVTNSP